LLSSRKKGSIVKGIPDYILVVSIVTPVILFSGVLVSMGTESDDSTDGQYYFLTEDWRRWTDVEWAAFYSMLMQIETVEDIPSEYIYFANTQLDTVYESNLFWEEYSSYIQQEYGWD
jgi:hypothetical protein